MSDPLPPEAVSPPAPRRVQFTMRTFFVAALWISAVFAIGKSLPGEMAAVCITALVMAGFYGIYHILQAQSAKIVMVVGTAAMAAGFGPLLLFDRHLPSDALVAFFTVSMAWGVVFSVFVGVVRAFILRLRRKKRRPWYGFWRDRLIGFDEGPESEARTTAFALAGAHFRWSSYVAILALFAQHALMYVFAFPSDSPYTSMPMRIVAAWTFLLDGPGLPSFTLFLDSHYVRIRDCSVAAFWLSSNVLGVPLYFALGWLIGRIIDCSKNVQFASDSLLSQASSHAEDSVEEPAVTEDRETDRE